MFGQTYKLLLNTILFFAHSKDPLGFEPRLNSHAFHSTPADCYSPLCGSMHQQQHSIVLGDIQPHSQSLRVVLPNDSVSWLNVAVSSDGSGTGGL